MQLVAVSRAQPQWRDVRGRQIFTSIVHTPQSEPLAIGVDGPNDNATAVHTEQLLAMPAQHYEFWTREFGVPRAAWDWCHWGENLTIDGIDEATLSIGDRLRIGDAILEVTSPRIPCFKLAWRLGQPDSVLLRLMQSGKAGFYLRVVKPGVVAPGDAVLHEKSDAITVADLSRLLIDREMQDATRLRQILALPALGGQASGMLARRAAQLEETQRSLQGRWDGWRDFRVAAIDDEALQVKSFHLQPLDGAPIASSLPGQFVTVRLPTGLVRTWSVSRQSGDAYRLTIKEGTTASAWMHREARVGTVLSLRAPAGRFVLPHGLLRPVLISAGIGVTPLAAMLHAHVARGGGPLHWLHVARNEERHALRREIEPLPGGVTAQIHYTERDGKFGAAQIEQLLAQPYMTAPFGRTIELSGVDSDFFICGPLAFEAMVRAALLRSGVGEGHIFSESFAPHGADADDARAEIRFVRSNVVAQWSGGSLLELAETAGVSPLSGCRVGACQSCAVPIVSGAVRYDPAPFVQPESGIALLCCARPASAVLEVDL